MPISSATAEGQKDEAASVSSTPNPTASQGCAISTEGDLHGEWIAVSKPKRSQKIRGKSVQQSGPNPWQEIGRKEGKHASKLGNLNQNKFSELAQENTRAEVDGEVNKEPVFKSPPLEQKIWTPIKLKSPRRRHHKGMKRWTIHKNSAALLTQDSEAEIRTFMGNVKTIMNVHMVSPNQLRFVDEPKPPDPLTSSMKGDDVLLDESNQDGLDLGCSLDAGGSPHVNMES
ncbi:putative coiled-coil domain-containing protein [Sesbania bispinosa]|nr:putative coiled-coil domain-containing protein [Sesbania bispinosa]